MLHRMTSRRRQTIQNLQEKEYRDAYVEEHINQGLASQIRAIRDERGWTQRDLAERMESGQSAISKLEDPDYGRHSMSTLKRLASAFDVALVVRFVPFSELVRYTTHLTPDHLAPADFRRDATLWVSEFSGKANTTDARVTGAVRSGETAQLPLDIDGQRVTPITLQRDQTTAAPALESLKTAGGWLS